MDEIRSEARDRPTMPSGAPGGRDSDRAPNAGIHNRRRICVDVGWSPPIGNKTLFPAVTSQPRKKSNGLNVPVRKLL
jgi:hypothetical protein